MQAQSDQQKLLVAELNHRVKNMLAVVSGIASQTMRSNDSMADFNRSFMARLTALSQAHGLLASQNWGPTELHRLIEAVARPYEASQARINVQGDPIKLGSKSALALSLVLHELFTNSAKYGAISDPSGTLSISWSTRINGSMRLQFEWDESGLTNASRPIKTGFGSRLIEATITHQLHGTIYFDPRPEGYRYEMEWPLSISGQDDSE